MLYNRDNAQIMWHLKMQKDYSSVHCRIIGVLCNIDSSSISQVTWKSTLAASLADDFSSESPTPVYGDNWASNKWGNNVTCRCIHAKRDQHLTKLAKMVTCCSFKQLQCPSRQTSRQCLPEVLIFWRDVPTGCHILSPRCSRVLRGSFSSRWGAGLPLLSSQLTSALKPEWGVLQRQTWGSKAWARH